jgi:hypothetical protein
MFQGYAGQHVEALEHTEHGYSIRWKHAALNYTLHYNKNDWLKTYLPSRQAERQKRQKP